MTTSLPFRPLDKEVHETDPVSAGVVRPRRRWPGGRAALGGLLVACAALVAFWAVRQAGTPPDVPYVIAAQDVAAGHVFDLDDLASRSGPLDDDLAARTFREPGQLIGGVTTRPLAAGQLVDQGDVAAADDVEARPGWELALALEGHRVAGQTGDIVDVVAAVGSGESATSEIVARGVRIQHLTRPESMDATALRVVLGLESVEQVLAVSRAEAAGSVFLVRANGRTRP